MKIKVNRFSFVSENDYNEKGFGADVIFVAEVWKEDDIFFVEKDDIRLDLPSKNGMLKSKGMLVLLNDSDIKKIN